MGRSWQLPIRGPARMAKLVDAIQSPRGCQMSAPPSLDSDAPAPDEIYIQVHMPFFVLTNLQVPKSLTLVEKSKFGSVVG